MGEDVFLGNLLGELVQSCLLTFSEHLFDHLAVPLPNPCQADLASLVATIGFRDAEDVSEKALNLSKDIAQMFLEDFSFCLIFLVVLFKHLLKMPGVYGGSELEETRVLLWKVLREARNQCATLAS